MKKGDRTTTSVLESVPSEKKPDFGVTLTMFVAWLWLMSTLIGAMLLLNESAMTAGNRLSMPRAVFQAVSATTLTGFTANVGIEEMQPFGQWVLLGLNLVGAFASLTAGGLAVRRLAQVAVPDLTVVGVSGLLIMGSLVLGAALGGRYGILPALIGTVGALGNSGVHLIPPDAGDVILTAVFLPLTWIGGAGTVVLLDVLMRLSGRTRRLTPFSKWTLAGTGGVFIFLFAVFLLSDRVSSSAEVPKGAGAAAFAGTATGYALPVEYAKAWSRPVVVLVTATASVGLALGGTAGGIGITTLAMLVSGVWRGLNGGVVARGFYIAVVFVAAFFALVMVVWGMLMVTEPQLNADAVLLLAAGSAANAGLSHDPVSVVGLGLIVMSLAMLAGRALSVGALWWMAMSATSEDTHTRQRREEVRLP